MIELLFKIIKKVLIFIHKLINFSIYKKGVILYGIPKLIERKKINIGNKVRINDNVFIQGVGGVTIKENVTLSYGVTILSTGYNINDWDVNKFKKQHKNESVIIGRNVWVCANVTVLPGVKIVNDTIIAAGSVVTKDLLEPYYIYGGVPARKIRKIGR